MIVTNTNTGRAALGVLVAGLAWLGAAGAAEPSIHIVDAWARATPPGVENGAVYCEIQNRGRADKLLGARSSAARGAEIHASVSENGVVEMRRIEALAVGAGASVELEPGGTHVMLVGLAAPLVPGAKLALTLVFEAAGEIAVEVPVVDARAAPAAHGHEHEHEHEHRAQ
jgi:periplasmic copper chaperone A